MRAQSAQAPREHAHIGARYVLTLMVFAAMSDTVTLASAFALSFLQAAAIGGVSEGR